MPYSPLSHTKPEVIGFCPRCNKDITEEQPTSIVLGQLYHQEHAPQNDGKKK